MGRVGLQSGVGGGGMCSFTPMKRGGGKRFSHAEGGGGHKFWDHLETECRLFPPVTIKPNLFPRAGYFFKDQQTFKSLIILDVSRVYSKK